MNIQDYDAHVQGLIAEIEAVQESELDKKIQLCIRLYQMAEENDATDLLGIACCYLGECYFGQKDAERAFLYLSNGIQCLNHTEEWRMLGKSYNILGLLLQYQGNMINAVDSYMNGIKIVQEHCLYDLHGILYQNFSALCECVGDYERALLYRKMSLESIWQGEENELRTDRIVAVLAMLMRLYMKQERMEDAAEMKQMIEKHLEENPKYENALEVLVNCLEFARKTGDSSKEKVLKEKTLEIFFEGCDIAEYFEECIALARYLLLVEDYQNLEQVLDCMENEVRKTIYADLHMQVVQCRIEMCQAQNREEELAKATLSYFKLSCSKELELQRSFRSVLELRSELKQAEVNNIFLSVKADTDELTGISNRRRLNEEVDRIFERAYHNQKNLGIEMLDIDHFKDCNDCYGHQIGDLCIQRIGRMLRQVSNEKVFCARYGGDEFVVIYYDMTDEEILKYCKKLKEQVIETGKEIEVRNFSISQGIINKIPGKGNKVWDYTSAADEALYWVKSQGRNDFRLIHHVSELEA